MTNSQVTALGYGFVAFLLIWSLVLIPQLITHHSRYGQINLRRVFTTAAVLLYGCLMISVVLFPLPTANTPLLTQTIQLEPFQWVHDLSRELGRHGLSDSSALSTKAFQQVLMNVVLFVPFGIFARMLWRRGIVGAIALGFFVSMTIEVAQLTANFGTAQQVYRIFDVDDLITNTTGAGLGWIVGALILLVLQAAKPKTAFSPDTQPIDRERIDFAQSR